MNNINETFIINFEPEGAFSTFFSWFHPFIINNINGLNGKRDRAYFEKITNEIKEFQQQYKTFPDKLKSINLISLPLTFLSYEKSLAKRGEIEVTPIDTSPSGDISNILVQIFMLFKNYGNPAEEFSFPIVQRKEAEENLVKLYKAYEHEPLYAAWVHEITKSLIIRWNQLDFYKTYNNISKRF